MEQGITQIIEHYKDKVGAVISTMEAIQESYGYLPREALEKVSEELQVPLALLFSLATFYSAFTLKPRGRHTVHVCLGTACHVRGGARILKSLAHKLGVKPGDTTEDKNYTLETVRCIGCCSLAPVVKVDNDAYGYNTVDKIQGILDKYKEQG